MNRRVVALIACILGQFQIKRGILVPDCRIEDGTRHVTFYGVAWFTAITVAVAAGRAIAIGVRVAAIVERLVASRCVHGHVNGSYHMQVSTRPFRVREVAARLGLHVLAIPAAWVVAVQVAGAGPSGVEHDHVARLVWVGVGDA